MRYIYLIAFSIALLGAFGCRKPESPIVYVQKEMLEYCWFPDGSYWIYEEENTPGLVDSIYSTGAKTSILPDENEGFQAESYGWQLNGTLNTFWQTIFARGIPPDFVNSYSEIVELYKNLQPNPRDISFFWDSRDRDTMYSYSSKIIYRTLMDSSIVNGTTYYKTIEIMTDPPESAQHTYQVIWARGVGIIKRSMKNGEVWNLVRHRIN